MKTAHVLVRHEARLFASLALWVVRRTHGTQGKEPFGYARGQGPMMFAFAFVCVVETLTMSVLLRDLPAVHRIVLALDVYGIVLVVALHAASVVRPHVLDGDSLRIRRAAQVDLRIPLSHIADVRRSCASPISPPTANSTSPWAPGPPSPWNSATPPSTPPSSAAAGTSTSSASTPTKPKPSYTPSRRREAHFRLCRIRPGQPDP